MSNFMNSYYSNLNDLTQINATDIQTESINTKALYINNTLFDLSSNITSAQFTDLSNNVSTNITNIATNTTNISTNTTDINNLKVKTTNQSFSGTTTSWSGSVVFPASSIASASINNSDFVNLLTAQNITGSKQWNSNARFVNAIRLDGSLVVNNNALTITNAQLQLIPNIGALNTKTTDITYTSGTTSISNNTSLANVSFSGNINTFSKAQFDNGINFSKSATSDLQTQISTLNTKSTDITYTSGTTSISNNTSLANVSFSGNINTFSKAQFDNGINFSKSATSDLQNQISSINTNLGNYALETEVQSILDNKIGTMIYYEPTDFTIVNNFLTNGELQYTPDGSTKINLIPIINSNADKLLKVSRNSQYDFLDISSNCHIFGKLELGNYPDVEYSLNAVIIAEGITAAATGLNTAALATLINTTIPAMNLVTTGIALDVTGLETDIAGLQQKTQKISYDVQDNTTTISAITSIYNLKVGNLESGLIQTENLNVRFIGVTEIRNDFIITNGFGADIDGAINQLHANAVSTFAGALTINNNFTSGGDDTNINSDNCTITGLTTIRLNTQNPILNVVLPSTVGAFNSQGILIGKEQTNGQARNCNIGYNYYQDGHANNYGYLGLNVMAGAINLRESFRWFDGGCSIPVGNLTITEGNLSLQGGIITSTTGNIELTSGKLTLGTGNIELTSGNITSTNGGITLSNGSLTLTTGSMTAINGDVNLTNGDLNIVNGDAILSNGNLTLGTGDIGVNNGDLNILNGELKTNTINKYSGNILDINSNGVGSSMNINSPQINIGYNQGIGAFNTINIGSSSSISTIYLNGIVSSAFGFNLTGSVLQW